MGGVEVRCDSKRHVFSVGDVRIKFCLRFAQLSEPCRRRAHKSVLPILLIVFYSASSWPPWR